MRNRGLHAFKTAIAILEHVSCYVIYLAEFLKPAIRRGLLLQKASLPLELRHVLVRTCYFVQQANVFYLARPADLQQMQGSLSSC